MLKFVFPVVYILSSVKMSTFTVNVKKLWYVDIYLFFKFFFVFIFCWIDSTVFTTFKSVSIAYIKSIYLSHYIWSFMVEEECSHLNSLPCLGNLYRILHLGALSRILHLGALSNIQHGTLSVVHKIRYSCSIFSFYFVFSFCLIS